MICAELVQVRGAEDVVEEGLIRALCQRVKEWMVKNLIYVQPVFDIWL